MVNMASYALVVIVAGRRLPTVVLGSSAPVRCLAGWAVARMRGTRFV
jgi:hypothetical protein